VLRYREIRPSAPVQSFIESLWILEHDGEGVLPQRVVPDGHPELILNLRQPFECFHAGEWRGQPRCFLAGQINGPLLLRPSGPARILGVRFHPHGAARVFHTPVHELTGRFTAIEDLSRTLSGDLNHALESVDPVGGVEAALWRAQNASRLRESGVAEAVRRIVLARGGADLAGLASEAGLSIRQFERRFNASVGLPPKLFCRMQRFIHVFRAIGDQPCNWVDTAVDCGYYDQAHLIRDFKSFSGETPAALLAEDTDLARYFLLRFGVSHSSNTDAGQSE
jgi:AraC-like DNA-binding protein